MGRALAAETRVAEEARAGEVEAREARANDQREHATELLTVVRDHAAQLAVMRSSLAGADSLIREHEESRDDLSLSLTALQASIKAQGTALERQQLESEDGAERV